MNQGWGRGLLYILMHLLDTTLKLWAHFTGIIAGSMFFVMVNFNWIKWSFIFQPFKILLKKSIVVVYTLKSFDCLIARWRATCSSDYSFVSSKSWIIKLIQSAVSLMASREIDLAKQVLQTDWLGLNLWKYLVNSSLVDLTSRWKHCRKMAGCKCTFRTILHSTLFTKHNAEFAYWHTRFPLL